MNVGGCKREWNRTKPRKCGLVFVTGIEVRVRKLDLAGGLLAFAFGGVGWPALACISRSGVPAQTNT